MLQPLAEHPGFALFGADAVKAGTATDAAACDTEKAITFDGWRTVHRMWRVTCDVLLAFFATHLRQAAAPPLLTESSGDYPELTYGAP